MDFIILKTDFVSLSNLLKIIEIIILKNIIYHLLQ